MFCCFDCFVSSISCDTNSFNEISTIIFYPPFAFIYILRVCICVYIYISTPLSPHVSATYSIIIHASFRFPTQHFISDITFHNSRYLIRPPSHSIPPPLTSYNFIITSILPAIPPLEHLLNLLLATFTFSFLLSYTQLFWTLAPVSQVALPNPPTILWPSEINNLFIYHFSSFSPIITVLAPLPKFLAFTYFDTSSIYKLDSNVGITQPCLNLNFTSNHLSHHPR